MNSQLKDYLNRLMVTIPGGMETIRDYQDEQKWINSDSTMSMPGQKGKLKEIEKIIEIKPFLLGKYPVTQGLYDAILHRTDDIEKKTLKNRAYVNNKPVVNVTWYDAVTFCNLLSKECGLQEYYTIDQPDGHVLCEPKANGYRLPTDAEWQYACKATSKGYWYGEIGDIAWYKENSEEQVHEVGKKQPNKWGLYDMLGNVWEWCWDLYDENTYGEYRVFRGGSWAEEARGCGSTCRRRGHPTFKIDDLGFRLAKTDIPFPVLETKRLILRRMELKDIVDVYEMRKDPRMHDYTDTKPDKTPEDTRVYIEKMNDGVDENKWIIWAMENKQTKQVIGSINIWNIDVQQGIAELGYGIIPRYQGKGLMKETLLEVIHYGFDVMNLTALDAYTEINNVKSIRLLESCHFTEFNRVTEEGHNSDRTYHMVVYRLERNPGALT